MNAKNAPIVPARRRTWIPLLLGLLAAGAVTALLDWSVDGMLEFLDEELRQAERATGQEIILQAAFDAELGFPRTFLRHVVGQTRDIEWEVYSLEPSR